MTHFAVARLAAGAVVSAASIGLASGCVPMKTPLQNAGPAVSQSGVQLAVVRQSCVQTQEPDFQDWDLVDEHVELAIINRSTEAATIHRERFRLLAPDGTALKPMTWLAVAPLTVDRGSSGVLQLRFMTRGGLECTKEMRLDADAGVTQGDRTIVLKPVSFVPARAL